MGTYRKGILGSFSGKVGTVVGSTWKGIDYMRSLPRPSGKAPTDAQMIQRVKMTLATGFLRPISALVNVGYKSLAIKQTGFNVATAQVISEAIMGIYPNMQIDYPQVLFSKGTLTGPWNAIASSAGGDVTISWDNNSTSGTAKPTDKAVLLIFNEEQSQYVYELNGADRTAGSETIQMPADFIGDTVHTWLGFISADKKTISTSVYAGQVTVA
jgi:hypothetical protein